MTTADTYLIQLYNRLWRAIEAKDTVIIEHILYDEWPRCSYEKSEFSDVVLSAWQREVEKADKILFPVE